MGKKHLFLGLDEKVQPSLLIVLIILTLAVMISLQVTGKALISEAAPAGILSFEFAGTVENAEAMLNSWGEKGRLYAGLNLGIDFLFLFLYPLAIGLASVMIASRLDEKMKILAIFGFILSWLLLIAGLLDVIENIALIQLFLGSKADILPMIAKYCAIPKFVIVVFGLLYMIGGGVVLGVKRIISH